MGKNTSLITNPYTIGVREERAKGGVAHAHRPYKFAWPIAINHLYFPLMRQWFGASAKWEDSLGKTSTFKDQFGESAGEAFVISKTAKTG